jgi:hypothetical protein
MTINGYTVIRFLPSGRVQLRDTNGSIFTARLVTDAMGNLRVS